MKKLLSLLLILALLPCVAFADALSGKSYEQLVELNDQINLAIWEAAESRTVTVPQGAWQVGVDIPAGHWSICAPEGAETGVTLCSALNDSRSSYAQDALLGSARVTAGAQGAVDWVLSDGQFVLVEAGGAVFAPYLGKPDITAKGADASGDASASVPTLAKGSKGEAVRQLQTRLMELGYLTGKADGAYGNGTASAVAAFQQAAGIVATGEADASTQAVLRSPDAPPAPRYAEESPEEDDEEEMVWIPTRGGKKYHNRSTCSGMIDPDYVTVSQAERKGFTPCKKCY